MYATWDELVPRITELVQVENSTAAKMLMSDIEDSTNKGNRTIINNYKMSIYTKLTEHRSLIAACALYLLVPVVRTKPEYGYLVNFVEVKHDLILLCSASIVFFFFCFLST